MQTQTLPIQLTPTVVTPSTRLNMQPSTDGAAFSQTLNREMAQRQEQAARAATPDAPAPAAPQAQPAQPVKAGAGQPTTQAPQHTADADAAPASDDAAPADADAGTAASATPAGPTKAADGADGADDTAAAAAAGAAAAAPVADMLALLANYKQLMAGGAATTPTVKPDPATAVKAARGTTLAADTKTLATLQGALKQGDAAATAAATTDAPAGPVRASMRTPAENAATTAATGDTPAAAGTKAAPDLATGAAQKAAPQSDVALSTLRDAAVTAAAKDTAPVTASAFQAQMATVTTAQTGVTPASNTIPAPLGSTAWDNQVSQKVVWMVGGADQTASLTLNPPDLGPVQVVLNVNNDQATVAFSSATPEVREALENAMPRLRDMLSDAGVTLSQASVNANMPDQRQADTSQGQNNNGRDNGSSSRGNVRSGETEIALPATVSRVVRDNSNVDTFA